MPRAVSSATISFGLVSVPVKLFVAASAEGVKFNQITPAGNRVNQKLVDSVTGEEVQRDTLLKGYEHSKDQYVTFTPDELKKLEPEKTEAMEITEFIPSTGFDPLQIEKSYYLGPDKGGDKGYVLLSKAMKQTSKVAVARWISRGREHLIVIRPFQDGLVLHQMFYSNEVRDFAEVSEKVATIKFHDVEESMAAKLVEQLAVDSYQPEKYTDGYVDRVKKAVEQKINGQEVTATPSSSSPSVLDLMAALKASLDGVKK